MTDTKNAITLDEAFELAESVHAIIVDSSTHYVNYLKLECLGVSDHQGLGRWAASFDSILDEEWFEPEQIIKHKYAARGESPAEAIERAANKVMADMDQLKGGLADYRLAENGPDELL